MALSTDIYTILRANSDVVTTFGTRIYPVIAPENPTYPCIAYTLTSLTPNENKTYAHKWDDCSVTIAVLHTNISDAENYANYVRTAMNRYQGTISSDIIKGVNLTSQSWEAIPITEDGSPTGLAIFVVNCQYKIMVSQNIAE